MKRILVAALCAVMLLGLFGCNKDDKLFCSYCNGEVNEGSVFCNHCGKELQASETSSENEEKASEGLEMKEASYGYIVTGIGICTDTELVIPSTFNSKPVVEIAEGAFERCYSINTVVIPSSIKKIGKKAFYYTNITSVTLSDGLEIIGDDAFDTWDELESIIIPDSIKDVGISFVRAEKIYYDGTMENLSKLDASTQSHLDGAICNDGVFYFDDYN